MRGVSGGKCRWLVPGVRQLGENRIVSRLHLGLRASHAEYPLPTETVSSFYGAYLLCFHFVADSFDIAGHGQYNFHTRDV